jgi:hypothetical protein
LSQKKISQLAPEAETSQYIDGCIDTARLEDAGIDRELIRFLVHLNDKLDSILAAVSKDTSETIRFHKGTAVDIGGAGMKMAVESPVLVGEFVHIQLVLSRRPLMHIDVYGQVVRWVQRVLLSGHQIFGPGYQYPGKDHCQHFQTPAPHPAGKDRH